MMKKILLLAIAALLALPMWAKEARKREMRTVWLTTNYAIDWPSTRGTGATVEAKQKQEMCNYLDGFVAANMNSVCFQARPKADAFYKSSYEPWSVFLTGTRGLAPSYDPLAFVVEECHKRGLECNVWINPYRFSTNGAVDCTTPQDLQVKADSLLLTHEKMVVYNPGLPAVRERLVNIMKEMIENYDIDGIIFDDYFYPSGIPADSTAQDYQLWKNSGTELSFADWRRDNVNQMVRDVWNMVQATKPYVKFSIGPAGTAGSKSTSAAKHGVIPCPSNNDWQYNSIFSDPLQWLEDGTIDFISPQLYSKTTGTIAPFGPMTEWWSYIAEHFGRHHYASHSISFLADSNTLEDWEEVGKQIRYSRQYNRQNAPGVNFFSARYINGPQCKGFGDYLRENVFTHKSLQPAMPWHEKTNFNAPENLTYSNGTLSWKGVDKSLVRYAVYAIPTLFTQQEAHSADFEGVKSDFLIGVTYTPSFAIDAEHQKGYYYAVTIVDGWNNEFAPAYINLPQGNADKVKLLSPVGAVAESWTPSFKWTGAPNATYHLQVSTDSTFETLLFDKRGITGTSENVDISQLCSNDTCYWRVASIQDGKFDTWSNVASFRAPQRPFTDAVELISPADGATFADDFNLEFTSVTADTFSLQVARTPDFSGDDVIELHNFKYQDGHLIYIYNVTLLGRGTFYWRVKTTRSGHDDGYSEVRKFTVESIPTGKYESGYVVKHDIDTYAAMGDMRLENLWVRSVKSEYGNITFTNSGQLNRGFTVLGDTLYVAGRDEVSSSSPAYLSLYVASTGEYIKDLRLGSAASVSYLPCNDVMTDDAGHIVVSNMTLNVATTPLCLFWVNTKSGEVTQVAKLYMDGLAKPRIDHCDIYGDVAAGDFSVFAVTSSGSSILRWVIEDGEVVDSESLAAAEYAPTSASNWGTAPRVFAESADVVFVNGGATYFSRYSFDSGNMEGSMVGNKAIIPVGKAANGGCTFSLAGVNYMLYPYADHSSSYRYLLVQNASGDTDFDGFSPMWIFPKQGLGNTNNSVWAAPCVALQGAAGEQLLYVYVPGNGMAAYRLSTARKIGDVDGDGEVNVTDVTALINKILGTATYADSVCDINADGVVNVTDVTALINIILGGE
ncbi:MAG: family 10 glycosylhydrolase [Bacteroidales bacterium]|nr:family 10 glycosylhydrolase [Bacteroidales bacterium]